MSVQLPFEVDRFAVFLQALELHRKVRRLRLKGLRWVCLVIAARILRASPGRAPNEADRRRTSQYTKVLEFKELTSQRATDDMMYLTDLTRVCTVIKSKCRCSEIINPRVGHQSHISRWSRTEYCQGQQAFKFVLYCIVYEQNNLTAVSAQACQASQGALGCLVEFVSG